MNKNLAIPKDKIANFCQLHHIRRLSVFGSAPRDDFAANSNAYVLVEFQKGKEPGFAFFDMEAELSQLLGRKVELHTPNFLSWYFRDTISKEAEVQYVQS